MKTILAKILPYTVLGLAAIVGVLTYQVYTLPTQIAKTLNIPAKDTIKVITYKTANLQSSANWIYFDGTVVGSPILMNDNYTYDIRYPSEVFDGFIYPVESQRGGKYYLWSKNGELKNSNRITGWCMTDGLSRFQCGKEYLEILYPIVEKQRSTSSVMN